MGAKAYSLLAAINPHLRRGSTILEIGSDRGEGSTLWFSNFAKEAGLIFVTVDFDAGVYDNARQIVGSAAHLMSGEEFLDSTDLSSPICFAYLDNFDWIWEHRRDAEGMLNLIRHYASRNLVLNNLNSQLAHLRQSMKLLPKLDHASAILFDDTWRRWDGTYDGKGGAAVPYLLSHGFQGLSPDKERKYVLLGRNIPLDTVIPDIAGSGPIKPAI